MKNNIDVLFIEPNSSRQSYQSLADTYAAIETPTWSLLLAQSCRSKGHSVAILDANALRLTNSEALKEVEHINPRLLCFVVYGQNPNSGTTNMSGAIDLANFIKLNHKSKCPKICFVGSHVSALPKEVLNYDSVDIVLTNEGVYALHNLLQSDLDLDLKNIKGIGWKQDNSLIINPYESIVPQNMMDIDLPGYAWDLLPYKNKPFDLYRAHFWHTNYSHDNRSPFAAIYTSLGCTFKCEFCMINILNRTNPDDRAVSSDSNIMRYWSSDFIIKEFECLQEKYGVSNIRLSDEMFFLNKKHYDPLIKLLDRKNYNLNMWAYSRVDTCRKEYLDSFKKVGINWLGIGIEAASRNIRQEITKGSFKDIDIKEVVRTIQDSGINVGANYIFGFPNENMQDLETTLNLALELNTEFANMYCAAALPGSPLYRKALDNNWELPKNYEEYSFYSYSCKPLPTKFLSPQQVLKFRDDAWLKYNTNQNYLNLVEKKFGHISRRNIEDQTMIKLKRKILGD